MPNSKNKTKEELNAYYKAYREKNRVKLRAYGKEYNKAWRKKYGYMNESKWKKSNPIKVKAEAAVQAYIKAGKMRRLPCQICGENKSVAHHPTYNEVLNVIFLCHKHHREIHYRTVKKIEDIKRV
jgi:hypothetical protein